jgi:predicted MPP superfamily phosphohydrolase
MRLQKYTATLTLFVAFFFVSITLLVRPLWENAQQFLPIAIPIMPVMGTAGGLVFIYAAYLRFGKIQAHPGWHAAVLLFTNLGMAALLGVMISNLGTERVIIGRTLRVIAPYVLFVGALIALIWLAPVWPPLRKGWLRGLVITGFILAIAAWFSLPLKVSIRTQPVVFVQQGGVNVVWETNLRSANRVEYGNSANLGQSTSSQAHGLRELGDHIQRIFIPLQPLPGELYFKAISEGVRSVYPISGAKAGVAESKVQQVKFPQLAQTLAWAAFSDLHEQGNLTRQLAGHLPWDELDFVVYLGDLLNNTNGPDQVATSILGLPAGGKLLPRLYARGNHEPTGPAARDLSEWLLPPGGNWYFTAKLGDAFFIVLDSGEEDPDADPKYIGLTDFAAYHQQQADWLKEVLASPDYQQSAVRIVLMHIPPFIRDAEYAPEFRPVLDLLLSQQAISLVMSGHTHVPSIWLPAETGLPFPVTTCGGAEAQDMAAVLVRLDAAMMEIRVMDVGGNVIEQVGLPVK